MKLGSMNRATGRPGPALWRHRDFMFLWGGQTVSEVGSAVTTLALPLTAVVVLHASTLQVGVLSALATAAFLVIALPAGTVVDRLAKRKLMVACDPARMLHVRPAYTGLVIALAALGGVAGGAASGPLSRRIGSARIIWVSILGLGPADPAHSSRPAGPGRAALRGRPGQLRVLGSTLQRRPAQLPAGDLPAGAARRMNAAVRWIVWGTLPLGGLLGGVLGSAIGIRPTLWVAAVGAWASGLWVFFLSAPPDARRPRARPAPGRARRASPPPAGTSPRPAPSRRASLHGDRLGEVARLVDVVALGRRQLAGEHLQRHGGHQRLRAGVGTCGTADQRVGVRRDRRDRPPRRSRWTLAPRARISWMFETILSCSDPAAAPARHDHDNRQARPR